MITSLTGKNQVTVPAEITKRLQLEVGARFDWSIGAEPNTILIRYQPSKRAMLSRLKDLGMMSRDREADSIAELIAERVAGDDPEENTSDAAPRKIVHNNAFHAKA